MMEVVTDFELILSESLMSEESCESPLHGKHIHGHTDSSNLYYVQFFCGCSSRGISLRCGGWIKRTSARETWTCALCDRDVLTREWFRVLDFVDKGEDS
jgi:hypothetical protein